jgi:hypothetical protein
METNANPPSTATDVAPKIPPTPTVADPSPSAVIATLSQSFAQSTGTLSHIQDSIAGNGLSTTSTTQAVLSTNSIMPEISATIASQMTPSVENNTMSAQPSISQLSMITDAIVRDTVPGPTPNSVTVGPSEGFFDMESGATSGGKEGNTM